MTEGSLFTHDAFAACGLVMVIGLAIEALFGWPAWLFRIVRHPVVWLGALISALERRLNQDRFSHGVRYGLGAATSVIVITLPTAMVALLLPAVPQTWPMLALQGVLAASLFAGRSLYVHVAAVARPLAADDLAGARHAVSQIVGRDPQTLDAAGVARAGLESLAENASDGVVAPLVWGVLFGLPGLVAYKAINTLDSMIGHRNDRFAAFGGFAARLDDGANLGPARLTGAAFALVSGTAAAWRIMVRDAPAHRSPNAGWPEAAMAGALNVRLSGPRQYGGHATADPWLNGQARDPQAEDLARGLKLYARAMGFVAVLALLPAVLRGGLGG